MIYVGLDVSLNSVAVCAVDETGKLIREGTTLADAPSIVQYLEPWADQVERVGLEAGPTSEWLTANVIELGLPAISLKARQVKAALSRHAGEDRSE
ncbi:transposase [Bradyrhizobium liaoningense]